MTMTETGQDGNMVSIEPLPAWERPNLPDGLEEKIDVQVVTYLSQGLRVKGYLCIPVEKEEEQLPGLIYCRGGIHRVGMVRLPRMMKLALRGYVVFAPVYRGNLGGEGREDFGGHDRQDLVNAVAVLRSHPRVRKGKIPLLGFSRGALMALLAAVECPEIGAIAVWGGVSDLFLTYEERVDLRRMLRRVVGHPVKESNAYRLRSPRFWVDRMNSPVLIIHGSEDNQVSVRHAHLLAEAMEQAGHIYAMRLYDGLGHVFPPEEDDDALEAVFAWFNKYETTMDVHVQEVLQ
jgi:dipeptidyl aminopeptidase/acylaminoacyl peptidase